MHPDSGFQHRLAAQAYRFLQRHPQAEHLEVVVITPAAGVSGGGALDQPGGLEQAASSKQIVASRPDLDTVVLPMLAQRFPYFSAEQIMVMPA